MTIATTRTIRRSQLECLNEELHEQLVTFLALRRQRVGPLLRAAGLSRRAAQYLRQGDVGRMHQWDQVVTALGGRIEVELIFGPGVYITLAPMDAVQALVDYALGQQEPHDVRNLLRLRERPEACWWRSLATIADSVGVEVLVRIEAEEDE